MNAFAPSLALAVAVCFSFACSRDASPPTEAKKDPTSNTTSSATPATNSSNASPRQVDAATATAANEFGFALYRELRARPGSLTISPTSIASALAMTCGGARGETATELAKVMRFDCAGTAGMTRGAAIAGALEATPGVKLAIANRLFGEKTYAFKTSFLDATRSAYGAPLETMSFKTDADGSRKRINGWVAEKTNDRIKDLLPPNSIDAQSRLVLVNAIHFLGDWASQFDKAFTTPRPFTLSTGVQVQVPTMNKVHELPHADLDDAKALELPYAGGAMSMLFIVPNDPSGLAKIEAAADAAWLRNVVSKLHEEKVQALVPTFTLEPPEPLALREPLKKLGMTTLFTETADLGDIAEPKDPRDRLRVSEVFHKTYVRVDEKGTEAAAATAVVAKGGGGAPRPPPTVAIDKSFLFAIRHRATGALLFWGRVEDPRGK